MLFVGRCSDKCCATDCFLLWFIAGNFGWSPESRCRLSSGRTSDFCICIFLMFSSLSNTFLILPLILQRAVAIDANELGVLILILKLDFETCLMIAWLTATRWRLPIPCKMQERVSKQTKTWDGRPAMPGLLSESAPWPTWLCYSWVASAKERQNFQPCNNKRLSQLVRGIATVVLRLTLFCEECCFHHPMLLYPRSSSLLHIISTIQQLNFED